MKEKKYPEGHFVAIGIALGLPFGMPLAISTGNPGLIGTGIPIGLAIGLALEEKYKREGRIRHLTADEKSKRKKAFVAGIGALIIGIAVFLIFLLR
ncbi:hypothetical protein JXB28_05010 [Candidatus Woesearchaeota archaeon]|nr:hypothetical protein [Candidatus Woesearchaeota archaeon]